MKFGRDLLEKISGLMEELKGRINIEKSLLGNADLAMYFNILKKFQTIKKVFISNELKVRC